MFKGLPAWRESAKQDADSTWRQMEVPNDLMQLLSARQELINATHSQWKALLVTLASEPAARTTVNHVRLALDQIAANSRLTPLPPRLEKTQ